MSPTLARILILAAIILGVALLSVFVLLRSLGGGTDITERMSTYAAMPDEVIRSSRGRRRARLGWLRLRLNAIMGGLSSRSLAIQMARANWRITVPEFLLIRYGAVLGAFLLGWLLFGSPLGGLTLAPAAYVVPNFFLTRSISQRQIAFGKQLGDVLSLLAGAVRAGYSLLQAIEVVVREVKPPASDEFGRVVREVGLGVRLPQALRDLALRMQNSDLDLMVTAVEIQYQVGGNMATMLSVVAETIRERMRLFGEVRVITTQQRYTSYLLTGLPVFVGLIISFLSPSYMARLFEPANLCFPIGAAIGIVTGHFVVQRIAKLEV